MDLGDDRGHRRHGLGLEPGRPGHVGFVAIEQGMEAGVRQGLGLDPGLLDDAPHAGGGIVQRRAGQRQGMDHADHQMPVAKILGEQRFHGSLSRLRMAPSCAPP
ncbi:MAG: hypothetical protein WDO24_16120 [Pseudomonadota bacterium]